MRDLKWLSTSSLVRALDGSDLIANHVEVLESAIATIREAAMAAQVGRRRTAFLLSKRPSIRRFKCGGNGSDGNLVRNAVWSVSTSAA
jgi:hypothetical protein